MVNGRRMAIGVVFGIPLVALLKALPPRFTKPFA